MSDRVTFELPDNFSTTRYYDQSCSRIKADAIAWAKEQMRIRGCNYSYVWLHFDFGDYGSSCKLSVEFSPEEKRLNRIERHLGLSGLPNEYED